MMVTGGSKQRLTKWESPSGFAALTALSTEPNPHQKRKPFDVAPSRFRHG